MRLDKSQKLFFYLGSVFVASLLLGDLIGGKAFDLHLGFRGWHYVQPVSVGLFAFPITFLLTDVVNDFYGRRGARFLTLLGMWMAIFAFVVLRIAMLPRSNPQSYLSDAVFDRTFGVGNQLFVASIVAYLAGQFLDIYVFQFWKAITRSRHLWLRATGSTLASQIIDTFVINFLLWWAIPMVWNTNGNPQPIEWVTRKAVGEYLIKFAIALALTPVVYGLHGLVVRGLGIAPEPHEEPARS